MTKRLSIYNEIKTQLLGIASIGLVIEPGMFDANESAVLSGTDPKHVAELAFGDDSVTGTPTNVIDKQFDVAVMVHLSPTLSEAIDTSYMAQAEAVYKAIEALYGGYAPQNGTWGGHAIRTEDDGGGGLSFERISGCLVTIVYFKIYYRHAPGDI